MNAPRPTTDFRKLLHRSLLLTPRESTAFERIPDEVLDGVFRHNFNGNLALAERALFNRYSGMEHIDRGRLEQEKLGIRNLGKATKALSQALEAGQPLLFVTDNDNDGSLAQAVLIEFLKALPDELRPLIHVEYAQPIGSARGLTIEVVEKAVSARGWPDTHAFTVVTADNGINNRGEQEKIQARYPNSRLIVTDHHLPDEAKVVVENDRTLIFNPKNQPTDYFKRKNISGANTLGVLLTALIKDQKERAQKTSTDIDWSLAERQALANMDEIGLWANLLDYANADVADMPNRPYTIEKALKLRPLMNVSTSMSNLVTGAFDNSDVEAIARVSQGLSADWIRERLSDIQTLNQLAQKLLSLYHRTQDEDAEAAADNNGPSPTAEKTESEYYEALSEEMVRTDVRWESINPNYIEQLRPIIFNLTAIDNKPLFMALLSDTMVQVFEELRRQEQEILRALRTVGLLRQDRRPSSTILYPIDASVTKLFNRRLLGKAYNQDNNGFLLILSSVTGQEAAGSMRSLYPISEILAGKAAMEKRLGLSVEFQGHEMAAGFSIRSTDGTPLTEERLSQLNGWIDDQVGELKMQERVNQMTNLELDFASVGLVSRINAAVKANLAGMWGVPAILRLSPDQDQEVWVTDNKTTKQVSLSEIVATKRYGYQAIRTSFHGDAIVVPIELLRAVVESGYVKALRLAYMDDGVYMAHQVVDADAMPKLVSLQMGRTDQQALSDYYAEHHQKSAFVPLTRQDLKDSPFFRFNRYGEKEFHDWENTIIGLLDETGQDILAVIDTEGTGLGKAPKCFNIGGTNVKIAEGSGTRMDMDEFEAGYFRNEQGKEFLLTPEQVEGLSAVQEGDDEVSPEEGTIVLHRTSLERGVVYDERHVFFGSEKELQHVANVKMETGGLDGVIYNRHLDGFAFARLISDSDFAITQEFEDLTGISTGMVRKLGVPAAVADQEIVDYYRGLRRPDGSPARIIFQAHNMPYDRGVALANLQGLVELMNDNLTSDTAKVARQDKLAYDDTPVSSFAELDGVPAKSYFYDSPYSDYSLSTFLDRVEQGKGGVFPDTTAKLLLRYRPDLQQFSIIDRTANREVALPHRLEDLRTHKVPAQLPNNAVKFSVERLSSRAMIRNILLLDKQSPTKVSLEPHEQPHRAALDLFQEKYHFDLTAEANIEHFMASLCRNAKAEALLNDVGDEGLRNLAVRFLDANRSVQARFHDGWIYEKVLSVFEPNPKTLRIPEGAIEQVNYLTDLPNSKIREVLEATIRFNRHFGVEHALVHEEHNNIRQKSADGQGLSDTAYEVVLPQLLAMLKHHNSYYRSERAVVRRLVDGNIKGSMVQTMVNDQFGGEMARDSFSMTQMVAFDRQGTTKTVLAAQALTQEVPGAAPPEIKMTLSGEVLPDNSALYALPRRHLTQEEVRATADALLPLMVNEQVKSAVELAPNIGAGHAQRLLTIAAANDAASIQIRDSLMKDFEHILFDRRDALTKKVAEMVREVFDDQPVKIPRNMKVTDEIVATAEAMVASYAVIHRKMNQSVPTEMADELIEQLRERVVSAAKADAKADAKAKGKKIAPPRDEDVEPLKPSGVRQPNFLPQLEIQRREPLKFALAHHGVRYLLPYVRAQAALAQVPLPRRKP